MNRADNYSYNEILTRTLNKNQDRRCSVANLLNNEFLIKTSSVNPETYSYNNNIIK